MVDLNKDQILNNYREVLVNIEKAAQLVDRSPETVKLVVVTKGHSAQAVKNAIEIGVKVIGENYVQEALEKMDSLKNYPDVEWHMIGHIQSRKSEKIAEHFDWVESLDRVKVARRLNNHLRVIDKDLLLEFNVSGETSKSGIPAWDEDSWDNLLGVIEQFAVFERLKICGLMTMPPLFPNPEQARPYFQKLRRLKEFLETKIPSVSWKELSMGMSADYMIAIQEGATIVRVGTAIMGPRMARE